MIFIIFLSMVLSFEFKSHAVTQKKIAAKKAGINAAKDLAFRAKGFSGIMPIKPFNSGKKSKSKERIDGNEIEYEFHEVKSKAKIKGCDKTLSLVWSLRYIIKEKGPVFDSIDLAEIGIDEKKTALTRIPGHAEKRGLLSSKLSTDKKKISVTSMKIYKISIDMDKCSPRFLYIADAGLMLENDLFKKRAIYKRKISFELKKSGFAWELSITNCSDTKKNKAPCDDYAASDHTIESTIAKPNNDEALKMVREKIEGDYSFIRDQGAIEEFRLIERQASDDYSIVPLTIAMRIVLSEKTADAASSRSARPIRQARSIYDCILRANLKYSIYLDKWETEILSCCDTPDCSDPCRKPYSGCSRFGEK
jgi:hypothetical protein